MGKPAKQKAAKTPTWEQIAVQLLNTPAKPKAPRQKAVPKPRKTKGK